MNAPGYSPIAPLFRVCDGARIRFADNKADSSAVSVLMLSPWPESLWAYRRIWDRVSAVAASPSLRVAPLAPPQARRAASVVTETPSRLTTDPSSLILDLRLPK